MDKNITKAVAAEAINAANIQAISPVTGKPYKRNGFYFELRTPGSLNGSTNYFDSYEEVVKSRNFWLNSVLGKDSRTYIGPIYKKIAKDTYSIVEA